MQRVSSKLRPQCQQSLPRRQQPQLQLKHHCQSPNSSLQCSPWKLHLRSRHSQHRKQASILVGWPFCNKVRCRCTAAHFDVGCEGEPASLGRW